MFFRPTYKGAKFKKKKILKFILDLKNLNTGPINWHSYVWTLQTRFWIFFGEIKTNKFINLENQNCFLSLSFWTQTQVTNPFCTQNVVTLAYVELSKAATWTTNVSNYSQHITARKPKLFTSKEEYSFSKLQIFSAM